MSSDRLQQFQQILGENADLAFIPISSDLQYLTGIPRDFPNYGHTIHPGDWLEGAWITPNQSPVLPLPRMTAEFGGLSRMQGIDIRVLGDWDLPARWSSASSMTSICRKIRAWRSAISPAPRPSRTCSHCCRTRPGSRRLPCSVPCAVIKSQDDIELMKVAGRITEAAFR